MKNILNSRYLIKCGIALAINTTLLSGIAHAGKKREVTMSRQDTTIINDRAKTALKGFEDKLNLLADPDNDPVTKTSIIQEIIEPPKNLFTDGKITIESDLDANVNVNSAPQMQIADYLKDFATFFKQKGESPVSFNITHISPVKNTKSKEQQYLKITYNQSFNGIDNKQVAYKKSFRIAEVAIIKTGNQWKTLISQVYFDNGSKTDDPNDNVTITDAPDVVMDAADTKDESYYSYQLKLGDHAFAENNYTNAYFAYKEVADNSKNSKKEANAKISELSSKMKNAGKYDVNDEWFKGLFAKAQELETAHKYEDAKRAYQFAFELKSTDKTIPEKIPVLTEKIETQKRLNGLFEGGQYEQAIPQYTQEIAADNANPYLYVGRAKCYGKIGKDYEAKKDFDQAIKLDITNLEAYKWQGKYFTQKKVPDYDKAYSAYSNYVNNTDKADPALKDIYCEMTLCKGYSIYNKNNFAEASDSFLAAIRYNANSAPGYLYLALCQKGLKNNEKALEYLEKALTINNQYGEAHYWKGKILASENTKESQDLLISELKTALSFDANNCKWNFELGSMYIGKTAFTEAVACFTRCIEAKGNESTQGLWKRGVCYYYLADYEKALADYAIFEKKGVPNPQFFIDFGSLYLMKNDVTNAKSYFTKSNYPASADACYGMAEALYLESPSNKAGYLDLFEQAFKKNISQDKVKADPFIKQINDGDFKSLRKKYHYN